MRAAILTVSTTRHAGTAEDRGGPALTDWALRALDAEVAGTEVVDDDADAIAARLIHWADAVGVDLILTTGGTGLAPRDVTPEATRAVIEREIPGLGEAMRLVSREHTPHWALSRALAGIRGATLIVNFPGSPRSIEQVGAALAPTLPHAVALISGASGPDASHVAGSRSSSAHPSDATG